MSNQKTFCVEIPVDDQEAMAEFQTAMDSHNNEVNKYIEDLAKELDVSEDIAQEVYYLRTRSRHTLQLEKDLIDLLKAGVQVKIVSWPCHAILLDDAISNGPFFIDSGGKCFDSQFCFDGLPQMSKDIFINDVKVFETLPELTTCGAGSSFGGDWILSPFKFQDKIVYVKYTYMPLR